MEYPDRLHVVVGIITNGEGEILLSKRPPHVPQGGLWEFPGGKLKEGEGIVNALERELAEELGLYFKKARPLIKTRYRYDDYLVLLDAWQVKDWHSSPPLKERQFGLEGQEIIWTHASELGNYDFPPANKGIITAIRLPSIYLICPAPKTGERDYLQKFSACISAGCRLFQLRFGDDSRYAEHDGLIEELLALCENSGARLMVNGSPECAKRIGAHGVHLNSGRLMRYNNCFSTPDFLVAASCHNASELQHANQVGVDFCVISPVRETGSHRHAQPLGWREFESLATTSNIPVYALGGMRATDLRQSCDRGGQGIAVLSGIWGQVNFERALSDYLYGEVWNKYCGINDEVP